MQKQQKKQKQRVSPKHILFLIHLLKEKFKKELGGDFDNIKTDANLYGFDNYDPVYEKNKLSAHEPSIKRSIYNCQPAMEALRHIVVREFEQDEAHRNEHLPERDFQWLDMKYLWKKVRKAEQAEALGHTKRIIFSDKYLFAFLYYLDLKTLEDLENAYEDSFVHYVGFYFSIAGFQMRNLTLSISKFFVSGSRRKVKLKGVHINGGDVDKITYTGEAWDEGNWVYMEFYSSISRRRIFLTGSIVQGNPFVDRFRAGMQGTTTTNRIFAWEVVFCKVDRKNIEDSTVEEGKDWSLNNGVVKDSIIDENDLRHLYLYLLLQRNVLSINGQPLASLKNLEAKHIQVNEFIDLVGEYRLWNFDIHNNKILQSIFEVKAHGTAYLRPFLPKETSPELRKALSEQCSLLNVSLVHQAKREPIVIAITFASGLNIVNIAMFDYGFLTKSTGVITGKFITLGLQAGLVVECFTMTKIKKGQDVSIKEMEIEEAISEASKNECLDLLEKLVKMKGKVAKSVLSEKQGDSILDSIKKQRKYAHQDVSSHGFYKE